MTPNRSLTGRTIALAEGRQLEDLAALLEKEGATPLRCPLVSILDAPDDQPVLEWLDELCSGRFAWVVLFTGEGVRRMLACAARHGRRDEAIAGLSRARTLTRGPKPVRALKEIGLTPAQIAAEPTTEGVIAALAKENLRSQTVGVQLYREDNPPLLDFLTQAGATVRAVLPYVYAPAADADRVVDLLHAMASGKVDALAFTSAPQVERLFEVAHDKGLTDLLRQGMNQTKVAAVGPVVADNLRQRGVRVDICPEQGFVMKNLVQHLKKFFQGG